MTKGGEFSFINHLRARAERKQRGGLILGIGDDAAVWRNAAGSQSVVSADLMIEGVDFRRDWSAPEDVGHKALAVSLSDLAAMGARPRWALISIGVPAPIWKSNFLDRFYDGFFALAERHGVALVGGDVSRAPDLVVIDSIVIGEVRARGGAVRRSGARPGDAIYVTGSLGGAAAGLRLLESGRRAAGDAARSLIHRQLRPEPRSAWGELLSARGLASAMIDLSDGLSSDLHHICRESGVGALLDMDAVPFDSNLAKLAPGASERAQLALDGGEDYELLFTVPKRRRARLPDKWRGVAATRVGEIVAAREGVRVSFGGRRRQLAAKGFAHFAEKGRRRGRQI